MKNYQIIQKNLVFIKYFQFTYNIRIKQKSSNISLARS